MSLPPDATLTHGLQNTGWFVLYEDGAAVILKKPEP